MKGRPVITYPINHLGGYTHTESLLDFSGVPKQTVTRHKRLSTDTERVITENFEYDSQDRLLVHKHKVDNNPEEILAQNTYNELSQLTNKKVGGVSASNPLQSIDYTYNIRGWMTKVNDPDNLGSDLFGYKINYNIVEGLETPNTDFPDLKVKPRYNGNIAEVSWKTSTTPGDNLRRYGYVYDPLNRLKAGFYQKDTNPAAREYFEKMEYDLNGNIIHLKRSGDANQGTTANLIDELNYEYQGNRVTSIVDERNNYQGYPDASGNTIDYNDNGAMTSQRDKGILQIDYNHLNLADYFQFNTSYVIRNPLTGQNEVRNVKLDYLYRADGLKLRKKYTYFFPKSSTERLMVTDYLDGFQYTTSYNGRTSLDFISTSEGYFDFRQNKYIYNYTDHLGNVRLSYFNNGSSTEVLEENNYYPFGLKQGGYNELAGNAAYQYKYNGKELQTETGMYDYGARFYMPDIGRWGVVDPLAETSRRWSTYTYAYNNPIRFIDPDGRAPLDPGDRFKTLRAAANDFGKLYNGLSINYNVEVRTMFYQATDKNGENYYSYTIPKAGTAGTTGELSPNDIVAASKLGEIVADGHTHSGDTDVIKMDGKDYSSANEFSNRDVASYKNILYDSTGKKEENAYGKPVTGYVATPDGGLREYIPGVSNNSNSVKTDAAGVPIKNYNLPIAKDLPSDPASGTLRLNNVPPTNMPNVLPKDFDPNQEKRY